MQSCDLHNIRGGSGNQELVRPTTVPYPLQKKKCTQLLKYTQEYNQLLKMMLTINKDTFYSSNNSIFKKHCDIHSSINSIILCSTFIWNTTQYFVYAPYNYNRDHNCLQRLYQHFLKTFSCCLLLHIHTKQRYYIQVLITIYDLMILQQNQCNSMNKINQPETNVLPTWVC